MTTPTPKQIKDVRTTMNLTQPQLAKIMGISVVTLSRWENGGKIQSVTHEKMLANLVRKYLTAEETTP
jgi:DNA-binding transcriptional regulator YiaG